MSNETPTVRLNPPYRAEHLRSFVRPPNLIDARDGWREGRVGAEALRALEDASIREIVAMQERVGLRVVSDGEFRKWSWRDLLFDAADGFTASREPSDFSFTDYSGNVSRGMPVPDVTAKIRRLPVRARLDCPHCESDSTGALGESLLPWRQDAREFTLPG